MSKAVLMSIQPKWVGLILNGKKTIEVRKTAPKLETPFKVYMYCTKEGKGNDLRLHVNDMKGRKDVGVTTWWRDRKDVLMVNEHLPNYRFSSYLAEGKVVAEFTCTKIYKVDNKGSQFIIDNDIALTNRIGAKSRLDFDDMKRYLGTKDGYAWEIENLKIYDQQKELSEFKSPCFNCGYDNSLFDKKPCKNCSQYQMAIVTRPPQSWFYVEEI